jgi:hypothetical protein
VRLTGQALDDLEPLGRRALEHVRSLDLAACFEAESPGCESNAIYRVQGRPNVAPTVSIIAYGCHEEAFRACMRRREAAHPMRLDDAPRATFQVNVILTPR